MDMLQLLHVAFIQDTNGTLTRFKKDKEQKTQNLFPCKKRKRKKRRKRERGGTKSDRHISMSSHQNVSTTLLA